MKNSILPILLLFIFTQILNAQEELPNSYQPIKWGLEQDVLPYLTKGFMFTGWAGMKRTRLRFTYAQANTPDFFRQASVQTERTLASHLSIDFFFKDDFKGLWLSPSLGHWTNQLKLGGTQPLLEYSSLIFSTGVGYNFFLYKGLYVSPWAAGYMRLTGTKELNLEGQRYQPKLMTPEISIKIGWMF